MEVINERSEISVRHLDVSVIRDSGWENDAFERLGLTFYRPKIAPVIGKVVTGGVADHAGIRVGDRVLAIDDKLTDTWAEVVAVVRASAGKNLRFEMLRDGAALQLAVTPEMHEEKGVRFGRIGVAVQDAGRPHEALTVRVSHGVFGAFGKALRETWDKSVFSLVMLGKMVVGEVSWRNLSGPVTIADYAGQSARLGLEYYLKFMALVSISLGVLNLLPIPILDGGHLLYYVVEIVKGGPVSEKIMEIGQQIGFALLLMLMAFAFYNDINRVFSG
jgi:regulator of sigma E protease